MTATAPRLTLNIAVLLTFSAFSALVLNPLFASMSALAFLGCGALLMASHPAASVDSVMRWWIVLLLPAFCLLSVLWSQHPELTLRYGLQLAFTIVVAVVISGRVSTMALMRLLFIVYAIGVLASLAMGRTGSGAAWLGIFGSKNAFAAHIAVFALTALAVLIDKTSPWIMRAGGLGGLLASGPLLVLAQSAGAIIMVVPCLLVMVLAMLASRLSPLQKLFVVGLGILGLAAMALAFTVAGDAMLAGVLEGSGKDATLTGRTDLWATGLGYIAERPLQGLGYRAFWVSGFAPAEELWAMFGVPSGAGFNFHNTYISNAVEIGLVGLALQIMIIYGGGAMIAAYALARPNPANALLLGLQALMILRSFIEVEVFFEFSVRSILAVATFIYAAQGLAALSARSRNVTARHYPKGLVDVSIG